MGLRIGLPLAGLLAWLVYALSATPRAGPPEPEREAVGQDGPAQPAVLKAAPGAEAHGAPSSPAPAELDRATAEPTTTADLNAPGEGLSLAGLARRKAFYAETRKDTWAAAEEARLERRVRTLPLEQATFSGAECRAHLCRLTFAFEQETALSDSQLLFDELRRLFGMDLAAERHHLPDGRLRITLYVN